MKTIIVLLVFQSTIGTSAVNIVHEDKDDDLNDAINDGEDAYIKVNMGKHLKTSNGGDRLYEGDMVLNKNDADLLYGKSNVKNDGVNEIGNHNFGTLWCGTPPTLPYNISPNLKGYSSATSAIVAGMNEISSKTCIKFVQRTTQTDYVELVLKSGCWSKVGRQGGKQELSLASGCWSKRTVTHELMHSLGFLHEQSRPDRDNYVKIHYENIAPANKHNFKKYDANTINSQGEAYDYRSVMHYKWKDFSTNGKVTITRLDDATKPLGNWYGMTNTDQTQLKKLYKCSTLSTGRRRRCPSTCRRRTRRRWWSRRRCSRRRSRRRWFRRRWFRRRSTRRRSRRRRRIWGKRDEKQGKVASGIDNHDNRNSKKEQLSETFKPIISELDENRNEKASETQNNEKSYDLSELEDEVTKMVLKKLGNDEEMRQNNDRTEEANPDADTNMDVDADDELVDQLSGQETDNNQKNHEELLVQIKDEVMKLVHENINGEEDENAGGGSKEYEKKERKEQKDQTKMKRKGN